MNFDNNTVELIEKLKVPLRLSLISSNGFPIIVSLWFRFAENQFQCITYKKSRLLKYIREGSKKCGFEISTNKIPYRGVRGYGEITLNRKDPSMVLLELFKRYKIHKNSKLYTRLMNRILEEVCLSIDPIKVFSWDFSTRMNDVYEVMENF